MANQPLGQVHAFRLAVTKLAADGTTPAGASSRYVSSALSTLAIKPNYTAGTEIREPNGEGNPCVLFKGVPVFNWVEFTLTLCTPDAYLMQLMAGGVILTNGAGIGMAWPQLGPINPGEVSLEVWGKRVVSPRVLDAAFPYEWHLLGRCQDMQLGEVTLGNNAILPTITGIGVENTLWGNGPMNNWPATVASDRAYQHIPCTAAEVPAASPSYVTIPVQT